MIEAADSSETLSRPRKQFPSQGPPSKPPAVYEHLLSSEASGRPNLPTVHTQHEFHRRHRPRHVLSVFLYLASLKRTRSRHPVHCHTHCYYTTLVTMHHPTSNNSAATTASLSCFSSNGMYWPDLKYRPTACTF